MKREVFLILIISGHRDDSNFYSCSGQVVPSQLVPSVAVMINHGVMRLILIFLSWVILP